MQGSVEIFPLLEINIFKAGQTTWLFHFLKLYNEARKLSKNISTVTEKKIYEIKVPNFFKLPAQNHEELRQIWKK